MPASIIQSVNIFAIAGTILCVGCRTNSRTLFTKVASEISGVNFQNTIAETPEINILTYEYAYNGGGVAAADFNNDDLCDLYFSGNMVPNRLYLNQGGLQFREVSEQAGVQGRKLWKTGTTTVDVNGDGLMDIYVCYSGPEAGQSLSNQLFINKGINENGVPVFTDEAVAFGVDAADTYSSQASFFDYDRDGDLDMFLLNHGNHFYSPFVNTNKLRSMRHPQFGNRLYRNDLINKGNKNSMPHFVEVSQEAGIHGGGINFGLGISISDINEDQWPDILVTNDYEEQDFLYLNNQDGTFKDCTKKALGHFSRNGMGTDIADYNNDGKPDLIEVDMWPEDNYRQKLLRGPDDYNRYQLMVDSGFHYQQMRNTLQLNRGVDQDGIPLFSEVGQLAGISSTDWSWAPLFLDADNDGFKDLFVTNGYLRDFTSMDFLKYTVEEAKEKAKAEGKELQMYDLVSKMPSTKTPDYLFRNNGDLTFSDVTKLWGMDIPNLTFGAAYADLDNDGDLELITNNTNEDAAIWENKANEFSDNNYLKVRLIGPPGNKYGVGAKIIIDLDSTVQLVEQFPTRGFQSSVDPIVHIGLGKKKSVALLRIVWPDCRQSNLKNIDSNQLIEVIYENSINPDEERVSSDDKIFADVTEGSGIDFIHQENAFVDFDRESLVPYQLSRMGPALAKGDVNGDGNDDFFVGGAIGQSGKLYVSDKSGHFLLAADQPWKDDKEAEDTGAVFFDVEGDGDQDLFVVSGGNEYPTGSENLDDRLYINDGKGKFAKSISGMVADHANGSCVAAADYDKDGDVDLFVGGYVKPGNFPQVSPGAVLMNESNTETKEIKFSVVTQQVNVSLRDLGMIRDAVWADFNEDSWPDLIVAGEWMPIKIFKNVNGKLTDLQLLENTSGLWARVVPGDFDGDGDLDFVVGNSGKNMPWKITIENPLRLYSADVNKDDRIDPIVTYSSEGKEFPVASRDELLFQVSSLRSRFTTYDSYAKAPLDEIIDRQLLNSSTQVSLVCSESLILENLGNSQFRQVQLPTLAQISCVTGVVVDDFNKDDIQDILLAGNYFPYRTQYGRNDAGMGLLMDGLGGGKFKVSDWFKNGFLANGDIRTMALLNTSREKGYVLVARNNDRLSLFEYVK